MSGSGEAALSAVAVAQSVGRAELPQPSLSQPGEPSQGHVHTPGHLSSHHRTPPVLGSLSAMWMCEGESSCSYVPASIIVYILNVPTCSLCVRGCRARLGDVCEGACTVTVSAGSLQGCTRKESQVKAVNY